MRYWPLDETFHACALPKDMMQILERIHSASSFEEQTTVRVLRLGRADGFEGDLDTCLYEATLELAPGVEIVIRDGSIDNRDLDAIDPGAVTAAQDSLLEGVERALLMAMPQLGSLREAVHDARLMGRRILASMAGGSAKASLNAVRLTSPDRWSTDDGPEFIIHLDTIGTNLTAEVKEIRVPSIDELHEALSKESADLERRHARRRDLMALGATGTIDQIALNAIDHFGGREETIRRFGSERRFWLQDGTALMIDDGCVSSGNGLPDQPVDWAGDWLSVETEQLKIDPHLAIGRPVTEVVHHPFLSSDIIVTAANPAVRDHGGGAILTLHLPRKLFCFASGRVWDGNPTPNFAPARLFPRRVVASRAGHRDGVQDAADQDDPCPPRA